MSNPRPSFPRLQAHVSSASTSSSAFQSYSSSSSLASASSTSSAPLPSPSASHPQHQDFFASLNQQQQAQRGQQQAQSAHQPGSYHYQPNREGAGRTAAETNNYLNDFALLAEAAKRAQIAVVMRDIEGMEL